MTRTTDLLGAGTGPAWEAWNRKIDRIPTGGAVLDHLDRTDWPGDDTTWDTFVALQQRVQQLCGADTGSSWTPPVDTPPERIPAGMWRGLASLDLVPAVDHAGVWVADWHNPDTRRRRGLLLVGPVGVGKTAIAAAIAHDTDGRAFWPVTDLVQHLMDSYSDNSFGYRFSNLARRQLLVIDDLGAERDTDGQTDLVVKLLDARHRGGVHSVITTNLTPDLRERRYGQRIESRLIDMCEEVPVTGDDRRLQDVA